MRATPAALLLALLAGCSCSEPAPVSRAPRQDAAPPAPDAARPGPDARAGDVGPPAAQPPAPPVRIAVFNAALERPRAGQLRADLAAGSVQAAHVAEIIARVRPDVIVLQEFDYDPEALELFRDRYLGAPQGGAEPIHYPHAWAVPSNTGEPSGLDLDRDGRSDGPGDALGFGNFPGHYAFAVLSRYPLRVAEARSFRRLKWADLDGALLPRAGDASWYPPEALAVLPLSSKNHVDLTVDLPTGPTHLLIAHPTPPVFDGPEDRNGRRNHDEIRLWADYLDPERGRALTDDAGRAGGLPADASFVILGDYNADPSDGDSVDGAIAQLLDHPRVHPAVARGAWIPASPGGAARPRREGHTGDPAHHTAAWGLRVDYVLPSADHEIHGSGVFWPAPGAPFAALVQDEAQPRRHPSSDHRLVWVDLTR